jgi:SAM-dependent methyltransferase
MRLARSMEFGLSAPRAKAASVADRPVLGKGTSYVQYGCGLCAPEGWINFDASPRLRIERVYGLRSVLRASIGHLFPPNARFGDIVRGLPIADGSAQGVYCSHVLEHVPRDDIPAVLRNTFRLLRPGGVFRLVVPDLRWRVARYLAAASGGDAMAADGLIASCLLGTRTGPRTLEARVRRQFGRSAHLWMYDFAALRYLLAETGFDHIRRCTLGDSNDPMFTLVEEADRFCEAGEAELAIEAIRPA